KVLGAPKDVCGELKAAGAGAALSRIAECLEIFSAPDFKAGNARVIAETAAIKAAIGGASVEERLKKLEYDFAALLKKNN
ncbi:MAG: hypothetical protein FWE62_02110, partial [Firmicutes bacterium]|nr:hypothetical protein [Bacillota bacterium]